jgi:hypothetical protein
MKAWHAADSAALSEPQNPAYPSATRQKTTRYDQRMLPPDTQQRLDQLAAKLANLRGYL